MTQNDVKVGDWVKVSSRLYGLYVIGKIVKFRLGGARGNLKGFDIAPFWKEDPLSVDSEDNFPNWWPFDDDVYKAERWDNG